MLTRRQVLTTTGAAAGVSLLPFSQQLLAQRPAPTDDRLLLHVGRENARLYRLAKAGALRSEHLHSLAANARLAALLPDRDLQAAAAAAQRRGDLLVEDHAQHARRAAEVRRYFGIDILQDLARMPPIQPSVQQQALATLAREGLAPSLLRAADALETRAAQMASREQIGAERFARIQYDQTAPYCAYYPHLVNSSILTCAWMIYAGPAGMLACSVSMTWSVVWYYICH